MSLYSYHIFLFPFQWFYTGKEYARKTLEEKTDLKKFLSFLKNTRWKREGFSTDTILNYNEYNYFYDFVRDVLYDRKSQEEDVYIAHLSYDVEPDTTEYRIRVPINRDGFSSSKEYRLQIDSILLHLYSTGVGVLSFHLNNRLPEQSSPDDILRINQFGRRLYPPFFGINKDIVGTSSQYQPGGFEQGLFTTQQKELAQSITVMNEQFQEDFLRYIDPRHFAKNPFQLPRFMEALFRGLNITTDPEDRHRLENGVFLSPLLDDRMFVVCWYGNDQLASKLSEKKLENNQFVYPHETDNWWYKFIFIDVDFPMCQNEKLKTQLIKAHTNARWVNYGTLYGISRYSFVCLTGSLQTLKDNNAAFLVNHVQTMYYKIAELSLVQRACVLRFNQEVSEIASSRLKAQRDVVTRVSNLYKQYLRFVNKIYFIEVTAQEQGIELYDLLQKKMRIPEQVKGLEKEIEELHRYINIREQSAQTASIKLLNWIATLLLPPTLVATFFSINFVNREWAASINASPYWPFWYVVIMAAVVTAIMVFIIVPLSKKQIQKNE